MTICMQCRFFLNQGPHWYDQFCKASPRERAVDPVTGMQGYKASNDLGRVYVTDQPYAYARDINVDGQCPLFQAQKKDLL